LKSLAIHWSFRFLPLERRSRECGPACYVRSGEAA
jgi:hypothetical protein